MRLFTTEVLVLKALAVLLRRSYDLTHDIRMIGDRTPREDKTARAIDKFLATRDDADKEAQP